jgi:hypothetical protein
MPAPFRVGTMVRGSPPPRQIARLINVCLLCAFCLCLIVFGQNMSQYFPIRSSTQQQQQQQQQQAQQQQQQAQQQQMALNMQAAAQAAPAMRGYAPPATAMRTMGIGRGGPVGMIPGAFVNTMHSREFGCF